MAPSAKSASRTPLQALSANQGLSSFHAESGMKRVFSLLDDDASEESDDKESLGEGEVWKQDGGVYSMTCNQVRSKLRKLVDDGVYKVTHLQRELGVSPNSYNTFLAHTKPWDGRGSDTFHKGYLFLRKRQIKGIKAPSNAAKKRKVAKDGKPALPDVSSIHLYGEEDDRVPVFDAPGEIRKKVNAFLRRADITQADFLRAMNSQVQTRASKIQGAQLTRFRGYTAPDQGSQSVVYYAAYVYFEKLRLLEEKPKSSHRIGMEKRYPLGYDRKTPGPSQNGIFMASDETFTVDEFCDVKIHRRGY